MTNMKPPQEGRNTGAPSLRGLQGRSATGLNGQAAKEEVSAIWRGGWMPENISGVPAGRSVFHLTSPLIGLLARSSLGCFVAWFDNSSSRIRAQSRKTLFRRDEATASTLVSHNCSVFRELPSPSRRATLLLARSLLNHREGAVQFGCRIVADPDVEV